jgi:putative oxidoreductase
MASVVTRWQALAPELRSVLRIVAALMFLQSGTTKLFGWPMAMPEGQSFSLMSEVGVGAILEFVGGSLLLVGLFTRPVAFILSGEMAVAYFQFHFPNGFWPLVNQGQPAVLYCFIWLYLSAAGAGPWSLDAVLRRSS